LPQCNHGFILNNDSETAADEPHCYQTLATLLKGYCPQVEIDGIYHSAVEALNNMQFAKKQLGHNQHF